MLATSFEYIVPESLAEATRILRDHEGARVLAGGHRLLNELKHDGQGGPALLVDLRRLNELRFVRADGDQTELAVGAMATLDDLLQSGLLAERYDGLAEAAKQSGDAQMRNRGTVCGSLAASDPTSDLPAAGLIYDATIRILGADNSRQLNAEELINGQGVACLTRGELIHSVVFSPPGPNSGSSYEKFRHPANGRAVCGAATRLDLSDDGTIATCRVAVTGAVIRATRLRKIESALESKQPTRVAIESCASQLESENLTFVGDHYSSAAHRGHLANVLIIRSLLCAACRATGSSIPG